MRVRSWRTTAPAPRFRWPTSELPICPSGSPTARPHAVELRVRVLGPEPVEDRRVRQLDGVAGAGRREPPAVEDDEADASTGGAEPLTARAAATICAKSFGSRLAPPTSAPSTSGWDRISAALSGFTLPPYWTRTRSAASFERSPTSARMNAIASWACSGVATLPGADRPDRLVGDHHVGEPLVGHPLERLLDLVAQLALRLVALALLLGLAHAEDRLQPGGERGRDLLLEARGRSR